MVGDTVDVTYSVSRVSASDGSSEQVQHIRLVVDGSSPTTASGRLLVTGSPPGTVNVINLREGTISQRELGEATDSEIIQYDVIMDNRSGSLTSISTSQVPGIYREIHADNPNPPHDTLLTKSAASAMRHTWTQVVCRAPESSLFYNGGAATEVDTIVSKVGRYTADGDHFQVESRTLKETVWTRESQSGVEGNTSKFKAVTFRMNLQRDTIYSVSEQVLIVDDVDPLPIPLVNVTQGQGASGSTIRIERVRRKRAK
jgi:hypothetical protein